MITRSHSPLVLVVDDEPHIRHVLEHRLRDAGYRVETACDGEEAYDLALRERPAVLITDERMPFLSGLKLCHRLRQTPETADLPVVMLTARRFADASIDRTGTNIAAVLSKPFSPREMLQRVQQLSEHPKLLAQHA
jgi:DNA-binding response OmpR family regulator